MISSASIVVLSIFGGIFSVLLSTQFMIFVLLVGGIGIALGIFLDFENPTSTLLPIIVLSLTIGILGVVGLLSLPDQKYGYETGPPLTDCGATDGDVYEYNELSSEAQEAFDSALEADRPVYLTDSNHGFDLEGEGGVRNCVRKDSQFYVLSVETVSGPNPLLEIAYRGLSVVGFFSALVSGSVLAGAVRS